jgi:YjbE family integral membrane protein
MDFGSSAIWGALGAIIFANILLSGDNAVVIAMAARSLDEKYRKMAIIWGSVAAIAMRVVLTLAASELLKLPYLKIIGAILLIYVGVQLLMDGDDDPDIKSHSTLGAAIRTILVADLVMSLDNVIAVVGAAEKAPAEARTVLILIGLATSIPIIIAGSTLLVKIMEKFPVIITLGAALLGFLAGGMLISDPVTEAWFKANMPNAEVLVGGVCAVLVILIAKMLAKKKAA